MMITVPVIKCSLHNHTNLSDGYFPPGDLLHFLKMRGYDVVAITDHMNLTIPHELQMPDDILFINGVEWWHRYLGMEVVSLDVDGENPLMANSGISWIPHPKYVNKSNSVIKKAIVSIEEIYGLELWNAGELQLLDDEIEYFNDENINYYAVDDLHIPEQAFSSWMEMDVDSVDKDTVIENLKSGDYWMVVREW